MISRRLLIHNLEKLGLSNSIVNADNTLDGEAVILLLKGRFVEWYTGKDIFRPGDNPDNPNREAYRKRLIAVFG